MARTPQEQVDDFMRENRRYAVVAGQALEPDPNKPAKGGRYKLANGEWHRLGAEACAMLPEGWPRWSHDADKGGLE